MKRCSINDEITSKTQTASVGDGAAIREAVDVAGLGELQAVRRALIGAWINKECQQVVAIIGLRRVRRGCDASYQGGCKQS